MIGLPFMVHGHARSYLFRAFQLSRQFLYKWTVNWRMIPEDLFLSRGFSYLLLAFHLVTVTLFLNSRWLKPSNNDIPHFLRQYRHILPGNREDQIMRRVTPMFVMESMLGSMAIGLLFARSLHYQFFAYLGWASPFLLWRSGLRPELTYLVWGAQELAWLVYPSTMISSSVVVVCLALQVVGIWVGTKKSPSDTVESRDSGAQSAQVEGSEREAKAHTE